MKRLLLLAVVGCLPILCKGQDTVGMCERVSNYYYGDGWIDQYGKYCEGRCDIRSTFWETRLARSIVVKYLETETPLKVIGVAAAVFIDSIYTAASSPNRLPEYFYVYELTDTGCVYVARTRWDTASPAHQMEFVFTGRQPWEWGLTSDSDMVVYPVYEAYFTKPIDVIDSFYVGGSTFNNYIDDSHPGVVAHPRTYYVRWMGALTPSDPCYNNLGHPDKDKIKYIDGVYSGDTLFHVNDLIWPGISAIFPIFDTLPQDTTAHNDTCATVTGLRVMDLNGNNVAITWDEGGGTQWEFSLVKGDTLQSPNNGFLSLHDINFVSFAYLDTSWYKAYVRRVCNYGERGQWSEGVSFYLPSSDTSDVGTEGSLCDRYTYLSPNPTQGIVTVVSSFGLRRLEVYSHTGQMMTEKDVNAVSAVLDVGMCPQGSYIVRIVTSRGVVYKKLIVR